MVPGAENEMDPGPGGVITDGMKTAALFFVFALLLAAPVRAQLPTLPGGTSHETAAPEGGGHFEIIQAQTAAKWTFRLDRLTGHVWILVQNKEGNYVWQVTKVDGLPADANRPVNGPYQIFLSGLSAKFSFLIDTFSGKTWSLTTITDKDGKEADYMWKPFAE